MFDPWNIKETELFNCKLSSAQGKQPDREMVRILQFYFTCSKCSVYAIHFALLIMHTAWWSLNTLHNRTGSQTCLSFCRHLKPHFVVASPVHQPVDLYSVCGPVFVADKTNHCCVIRRFDLIW